MEFLAKYVCMGGKSDVRVLFSTHERVYIDLKSLLQAMNVSHGQFARSLRKHPNASALFDRYNAVVAFKDSTGNDLIVSAIPIKMLIIAFKIAALSGSGDKTSIRMFTYLALHGLSAVLDK